MTYEIIIDGKVYRLELTRDSRNCHCKLDGRSVEVDAQLVRPDVLSLIIGNQSYEVKRERSINGTHLWVGSARHAAEVRDPRSFRGPTSGVADAKGPRKLVASMPGKVIRFLLAEKAVVEIGQGVVVVEAMKMQNEIKSPKKGILQRIVAVEGATVNAGDVLAIVE